MSKLIDKLRPKPKSGKVGKVVPCPRCGRDAEHYTANFVVCPRCDAQPPEAKALPLPPPADDFISFELDFDDEPTQPGDAYCPPVIGPTWRWYKCTRCTIQTKCDPMDVAVGKRCGCGGPLLVSP